MELDSAVENQSSEKVSDASDEEDDDLELEDIGHMVVELETGWEPPREGAPQEDAGGDEPIDLCLLGLGCFES